MEKDASARRVFDETKRTTMFALEKLNRNQLKKARKKQRRLEIR
ncbi:hypothetical protein DOY81_008550 [Sarcophaga bullata]|nr:hypothetical protein DOY81_008550 [Sarcophaga bullata]